MVVTQIDLKTVLADVIERGLVHWHIHIPNRLIYYAHHIGVYLFAVFLSTSIHDFDARRMKSI